MTDVKPLTFEKTNNCPPTWDTGLLPLGRYRVQFCGEENLWKAIRGHALIIGREMSKDSAMGLCSGYHRDLILAELVGDDKMEDLR